MNNRPTAPVQNPKSFSSETTNPPHATLWNRRNVTIGIGISILITTIAVACCNYVHKNTIEIQNIISPISKQELSTLEKKIETIKQLFPTNPDPLEKKDLNFSVPNDPINAPFYNRNFPIAKHHKWRDERETIVFEDSMKQIATWIQDDFYKDHLLWIAKQYENCSIEVNKFTKFCITSINRNTPDCQSQFKKAQDACSDAKEAGITFCSETRREDAFKESAEKIKNICVSTLFLS